MNQVSVSVLKAKLSQYLDAVRRGEEVLVTDRGQPVARLIPIRGPEQVESRRDQLIRAGRLRPPLARLPRGFWRRPRPADPTGRGLQVLLEERAEGR